MRIAQVPEVWRAFRSRPAAERWRLAAAAWRHLRSGGIGHTVRQATRLTLDRGAENQRYAQWCRMHTPDAAALHQMAAACASFRYQPVISILTPVYNTHVEWLEACAASVVAQVYPRWEWHLADDGSSAPATLAALERIAASDERIVVHRLPQNAGISAASNVALRAASGDYVALLDHDDALLPHAAFRVVAHLNAGETLPDVVYSDEDKLEEDGTRSDAYFKPDWSPDTFLSNMYACHWLLARRALVLEVGGFRPAFDFAQDYDLVLRLMERADRIDHVADVLYHWRKVPQSTASSGAAKPTAHLAGGRALQDYLDRHHINGRVEDAGPPGFYRVVRDVPASIDVCVVGHHTGAEQEQLRHATAYPSLTFARAAAETRADMLLFLDAAFQPESPEWLQALLQPALAAGVGAVGAKLLRADGTLEHIGLVLGLDGVAGRPLAGAHASDPGYFGSALQIRTVSAVSGSCLLTPREVFAQLAEGWPIEGDASAVDYCLRLRRAGRRVVFTPWSVLRRRTAAPLPTVSVEEAEALGRRWGAALADDPFYSPHLTRERLDYRVRT
jgi:GT2 family glycosyltransferase